MSLTPDQKKRIEKLRTRKDELTFMFIGAMEEINSQIKEIKSENVKLDKPSKIGIFEKECGVKEV